MLSMTLQLIEAGLPVILVINIMDEAERMGLVIEVDLLREKLQIPVIAAAAAKKRGLPELKETITSYSHKKHAVFGYSNRLESDIDVGGGQVYLVGGAPSATGEDEERMLRALRAGGPVVAVGVAFAVQEVAEAPHDGFDERLDWIVTERGARRVGG